MKTKGIPLGLVQTYDPVNSKLAQDLFDLRKMTRDYLNILHVPFDDLCCPDSDTSGFRTVGYDGSNFKSYNSGSDSWDTISISPTITSNTIFGYNPTSAHAGGGQASATQLGATYFNNIVTVATDGDSVQLPAFTAAGQQIIVRNTGVSSLDIYPKNGASQQIDSLGTSTAIRIAPNTEVMLESSSVGSGIWYSNTQKLGPTSNGTAALPSLTFGSQKDMGLYKVSSTELGISVSGAKSVSVNASGLVADHITEKTSGFGISLDKPIIRKAGTAKALNTTGSITAAELAGGLITSTTAAGVSGTLPDATSLGTQLGATQGTVFDFIVDNSAGANTFTVVVNTGITVGTTALTGGDTLTVSTAQAVGMFRLIFTSATAAILRRIF